MRAGFRQAEVGRRPARRQGSTRWATRFSVADAYLFTISNWTVVGIDTAPLKNLSAFMARRRPVRRSRRRETEGLIK
jgi:glutathione S-transferase